MGMARGEWLGDRGAGGARGEPVAEQAISASAAYEDHADALRAFLAASVRDAAEAEDLLHEAFLRLLTEIAAGRAPDHPRAWLFRVATNLATSRARRRGVAARRAPELLQRDVAPSPEEQLVAREAALAVHGRLAGLPDDARVALLLAAHGFSGAEIARRIGRTELATRSLLCRHRGRLRSTSPEAA
ncbi:MAG TPA: RNA polymerase sigma factor [Candidatus Limnocylindria bacterium]|jgi:RNA polymerase sigma-70 factor (ECF subfamily)|nr:RNA polymerase sigma factor [Candidatus Limnocylindria bacterium]